MLCFDLLYSRAVAQSKLGNFRYAIEDCTKALCIEDNHLNALLLRAECHQYIDNFEDAIEDYEAALRNKKIETNDQQCTSIKTKIKQLKREMKRNDANEKKSDGDKQKRAKNFEAALKLYGEAIELWPENVSFYESRASCLMNMRNYEEAVREYRSMLKIDRSISAGYYNLIECLLIVGDIFGVERTFSESVEFISKDDVQIKKYKKQWTDLKDLINKINFCKEDGHMILASK